MSRRASPLDTEPCRSCTSFTDYVKETRRNLTKGTDKGTEVVSTELTRTRTDCPLDREELGNKSWGLLHTIASKFPDKPTKAEQKEMKDFFSIFSNIYPCDQCSQDFKEELKKMPIETSSQEAFSQWLCRIHNKVNVKLGKDSFDCSKVNERWRDGWSDGSCD